MSGAQGPGAEYEQNSAIRSGLGKNTWETAPQAEPQGMIMSDAQVADYHLRESNQNLRAAALEVALRCAQPGAQVADILSDAAKFLVWLTNAT